MDRSVAVVQVPAGSVPVLFVHGILSGLAMWDKTVAGMNGSVPEPDGQGQVHTAVRAKATPRSVT